MVSTDSHPISGISPCFEAKEPLCSNYSLYEVYNKGDYAEAVFECEDGTKFTEIHTIQCVERDDGKIFEPNQQSYGCDEVINIIWTGKTNVDTVVFVGKCGDDGPLFSDVYKYDRTKNN